jgi:twinkle protein
MINYSDFDIHIPPGKNSGEFATTCPQCSHTRKKKTQKCLSVNLDKKVWRCNHCDWSGGLKTQFSKPEYKRPQFTNNTELSDKAVKWFATRGISQTTLNKLKISEGVEYMPQINKEINTIQFNYFREGELINIKYRDGAKNFKLFKDGEKILYNIDSLKVAKTAYIVEGEMDVLSFVEVGIENVVSVPNGATIGTNNLDYIDNSIELLNHIETFIIAVDNDQAGRKLAEDLIYRFGIENCKYVDYGRFKDANDFLLSTTPNELKQCLTDVKDYPIEGVFTISDYMPEIMDMYDNGLEKGWETGMTDFDRQIRFVPKYMTCITGIPSHGKSEFLDQICLTLTINNNAKGAFFSPENKPTKLHFSKMARKIIGKWWDGQFRMTKGEVLQSAEVIDNKIFFIQPEENYTIDSILAKVKQLKRKHGIEWFVIDAWNKLEHKWNGSETKYIAETLTKIERFCVANNLHFFLVAHPMKILPDLKTGKYPVPTPYHISGSANFYNMFDNHITVYRNFEHECVEIHVMKVKFAHWGKIGSINYWYDAPSGRYYSTEGIKKDTWLNGANFQPTNEMNRVEAQKEAVQAMKQSAIDLPDENPFSNEPTQDPFTP